MATESREERRLIRQRGAGARELKTATFGFSFGGLAPMLVPTLPPPLSSSSERRISPRKERSPTKIRSPQKSSPETAETLLGVVKTGQGQETIPEEKEVVEDVVMIFSRPDEETTTAIAPNIKTRRASQVKPSVTKKTRACINATMPIDHEAVVKDKSVEDVVTIEAKPLQEIKQAKKRGRPPKQQSLVETGQENHLKNGLAVLTEEETIRVIMTKPTKSALQVKARSNNKVNRNPRKTKLADQWAHQAHEIATVEVESLTIKPSTSKTRTGFTDAEEKKQAKRHDHNQPCHSGSELISTIEISEHVHIVNNGSVNSKDGQSSQNPTVRRRRSNCPDKPSGAETLLRTLQEEYQSFARAVVDSPGTISSETIIPKRKRGRPKRENNKVDSGITNAPSVELQGSNNGELPTSRHEMIVKPRASRLRAARRIMDLANADQVLQLIPDHLHSQTEIKLAHQQDSREICKLIRPQEKGIAVIEDYQAVSPCSTGNNAATVDVIQPKRRGRPPKQTSTSMDALKAAEHTSKKGRTVPIVSATENDTPVMMVEVPNQTVAKRKRKADTATPTFDCPIMSNSENVSRSVVENVKPDKLSIETETIPVRRRGRPRKVRPSIEVAPSAHALAEAGGRKADALGDEQILLRVRGRKRREPPTESRLDVEQDEKVATDNIEAASSVEPSAAKRVVHKRRGKRDMTDHDQQQTELNVETDEQSTKLRSRNVELVDADAEKMKHISLRLSTNVASIDAAVEEEDEEEDVEPTKSPGRTIKIQPRRRLIGQVKSSQHIYEGRITSEAASAPTDLTPARMGMVRVVQGSEDQSVAFDTFSQFRTQPLQPRSANVPSPSKRLRTSHPSQETQLQKPTKPFPVFLTSTTRRGRSAVPKMLEKREWQKEDWFEPNVPKTLLRR